MLRLNLSVGALSISDNTLALFAGSILPSVTSGAASLIRVSVITLTKPAFLFWVKNSLACSNVTGSFSDTLGPELILVFLGNKPSLTASRAAIGPNLGPVLVNIFWPFVPLSSFTKSDTCKSFKIFNIFLFKNCGSIAFSVPINLATSLNISLPLAFLFTMLFSFFKSMASKSFPNISLAVCFTEL